MKIKAKLEPGKVAVVTGGSSEIGKALACDLVKRGMHLWIVAQKEDLLEAAHAEVEAHRKTQDQVISVVSADVSELDQVRMAVNQICKASGPPDLLINAAGVAHPGYVQDLDIDIFNWMMATNYFGTVYMTKEVLPAMIKRSSGYILNISSGATHFLFWLYGVCPLKICSTWIFRCTSTGNEIARDRRFGPISIRYRYTPARI